MKWWAPRPEPVIICYGCRKRISEAELAAGAHDHKDTSETSDPVILSEERRTPNVVEGPLP